MNIDRDYNHKRRSVRLIQYSGKKGFNLIEVVIALAVCTIGILSILALLPVGLNSERDSINETSSINLLHLIDTDVANTPATNTTGVTNLVSYRYNLPLPSAYQTTGAATNTFYVNGGLQLTNSGVGARFFVVYTSLPPATNGVITPPPL